jgi:hypothetical protein
MPLVDAAARPEVDTRLLDQGRFGLAPVNGRDRESEPPPPPPPLVAHALLRNVVAADAARRPPSAVARIRRAPSADAEGVDMVD